MIENGKISGTFIGQEDKGIFTCFVYVDMDCGCGGFGGYALDEYIKNKKARFGTAYGLEFIKRVLETLDIHEWERLKGTPCRVETEGVGGRILKIGHFMKNQWFDPNTLLEEMKELEFTQR